MQTLHYIAFSLWCWWPRATAKVMQRLAPPWAWGFSADSHAAEKQKTPDCVPWSSGCPKTKAIFLTEEQGWILSPHWIVLFLAGAKAVLFMPQDLWAVDVKQLSIFMTIHIFFHRTPGQEANEWLPGRNPTGDSRLVTGSTLSNSLFLWDEGFFPGGSHVTHVINSGRRASPVMLRWLDTIYAQAVPTTPHSTPR